MSATASALLSIVLPFFICVTMIIVLRKIAVNIGLLDRPCERKKHEGLVPLVGGIAMFTAFSISTILLFPHWSSLVMVLIALLVVSLGVLDDIHGLQTRKRFLVQMLAAVAMVYVGGVQISQLGNLFGDGVVQFGGFFALIFTVFATVGVINAMNMVDGSDGLAGSLALISFLALAYVAYSAGDLKSANMILVIIGALFAFLLFNIRLFGLAARVFMGDAGSMFIGLLLAWFFISLSQGDKPSLSAVSAGWIFGLPLLDISAVMTRRLFEGRSPFTAGRDHIHHLLIDHGYSVNKTLSIIVVLHLLFVSLGLIANNQPGWDPALFWLFVILVACHLVYTRHILSQIGRRKRTLEFKVGSTSSRRAESLVEQEIPTATEGSSAHKKQRTSR